MNLAIEMNSAPETNPLTKNPVGTALALSRAHSDGIDYSTNNNNNNNNNDDDDNLLPEERRILDKIY